MGGPAPRLSAAARHARERVASLVLAALLALAPTPALPAPAPTATAKPDAATRRCHAAQRRVERQQEVVDRLAARIERERKARDDCRGKRACSAAEHALKASDARKARNDEQLARLRTDAKRACDR